MSQFQYISFLQVHRPQQNLELDEQNFEVCIASSASSTFCCYKRFSIFNQVFHYKTCVFVDYNRSIGTLITRFSPALPKRFSSCRSTVSWTIFVSYLKSIKVLKFRSAWKITSPPRPPSPPSGPPLVRKALLKVTAPSPPYRILYRFWLYHKHL